MRPQLAARAGAWHFAQLCALAVALVAAAETAAAADRAPHPARLRHSVSQAAPATSDSHEKAKAAPGHKATPKRAQRPAVEAKEKKPGTETNSTTAKSAVKKRHPHAEPEPVDDPVIMHQAATRHGRRLTAQVVAVRRIPAAFEAKTAPVPVEDKPAVAEKKKLTVDDFLRAAQGTAVTAEIADRGVSHPDDVPIETNDSPEAGSKPKPVTPTVMKPAPVVKAVVRIPAEDVVAAGVSYDDAPKTADLPHSRVVQGFGGEVDVLPDAPTAQVATASKRGAVVEDATPEDRREITDDAMKPMVVPIYTRSGHLIVPPPLKGTREILVHQNQMADSAGLTRIQDDDDLNRMRAQHLLVSFPDMPGLEVNEDLPVNRRYARPWTVKFAVDTARSFYARFHEPLRLNSAVRTVDYQLRLQRVNGNAAAVDGDAASPHLTGQAIDFGKHGMSLAEIAWMRAYLLPLMQAGKVDVEEEFQQACFHISVYGSYMPKRRSPLHNEVAQLHGQ